MKFEDYNWHDSVVRLINIDRTSPGINDTISFEIEWVDGGLNTLQFNDVYWVNMDMNWGIVADETILNATTQKEGNSDLKNFYSKWQGMMNDIELTFYLIELNTTGSIIKIIAKDFKML